MGFAVLLLSLAEIILGFLLPAYASLSLISKGSKPNSDEYTRWGAYWIIYILLKKVVFGSLCCLPDFLSGILLLVRVAAIAFLVLPQLNGSLFVWNNYLNNKDIWEAVRAKIRPFVVKS